MKNSNLLESKRVRLPPIIRVEQRHLKRGHNICMFCAVGLLHWLTKLASEDISQFHLGIVSHLHRIVQEFLCLYEKEKKKPLVEKCVTIKYELCLYLCLLM